MADPPGIRLKLPQSLFKSVHYCAPYSEYTMYGVIPWIHAAGNESSSKGPLANLHPRPQGCPDNLSHAQPAMFSSVDLDHLGIFLAAIEKEVCWIKALIRF